MVVDQGRRTTVLIRRSRQRAGEEEFLVHPEPALLWGGALLALVALGAILVPVGPLDIDSRWAELMQDLRAPWLEQVALVFDALGRGWSFLTIAAIALVLGAARRWLALLAFAVTEAVTPLLVAATKALVDRPRPADQIIHPHGSSFPSGHAAYAGATTTALVLLFTTAGKNRRPWYTIAVLVSAGMAWSRTYLQVHWLTDVVAGAILGLAVTLTTFATVQILQARRSGNASHEPAIKRKTR